MTEERMALIELVERQADGDLVREMLAFAAECIMEAEVEVRTGVVKGARSSMREAQRNGYALAAPPVIAVPHAVAPPFPLPGVAMVAALADLDDAAAVRARVARNAVQRPGSPSGSRPRVCRSRDPRRISSGCRSGTPPRG